jgi:hypothetical protein
MKSFKSYLLIAVFALSTVFVPSAFTSSGAPVRGIDVVVLKNPGTSARQHVTPDKNGKIDIQLPGPGNYTIKDTKGKVLWSGSVTKAEKVSLAVPKAAAE